MENSRHSPAWELLESLLHREGSVIPRSLLFALPCAFLAWLFKAYEEYLPNNIDDMTMMSNSAAYTGFSFAMGFLFVFRTSQAYSRFWEGVTNAHRMLAEWSDFASAVVAFAKYSKVDEIQKQVFQHRLVRLLSILHASALATLRGIDGSNLELIDIGGLDDEMLEYALLSKNPTLLIGQWIVELVMEGLENKIIIAPPPIVSRCFQEFANGMVAYHDSMKIQTTAFPFHYTQMSAILLLVHWIMTPFVMCQWVNWQSWVFFLTFIQVLFFWALYFTACEIEYPFKRIERKGDSNSAYGIQADFNQHLLLLIDPKTRQIPTLSMSAELDIAVLKRQNQCRTFTRKSQMPAAPTDTDGGVLMRCNMAWERSLRCCRENTSLLTHCLSAFNRQDAGDRNAADTGINSNQLAQLASSPSAEMPIFFKSLHRSMSCLPENGWRDDSRPPTHAISSQLGDGTQLDDRGDVNWDRSDNRSHQSATQQETFPDAQSCRSSDGAATIRPTRQHTEM